MSLIGAVTPVLTGLAGITVTLAVVANLPTSWWMPPKKATLKYLSSATLQTLDGQKRAFSAQELWQDKGVVVMAVRRPG